MKPKRIILIRHGQSEGNADLSVYKDRPDHSISLTALGRSQAFAAGQHLKQIVKDETVAFYVSPYYRTRETYSEIIKSVSPSMFREDPRLREHEWAAKLIGENRNIKKQEAKDYGVFYYRFEHGESCGDVYDRLSTFLETLHRDFDKTDYPDNTVIIGHGMTNRIFLMRWFHMTVEQFELMRNPKNCGFYVLTRKADGKFELTTGPELRPERESKF